MLDGQDPYRAFLNDSPDIILTQAPNYLHGLYLLLSPLGSLDWGTAKLVWVALGVTLAVGAVLWFGQYAGWSNYRTALLVALFLMSTPVRIGLANGQHALLLLLCAAVAFANSTRWWSGTLLALTLTKYSFAPLGFETVLRRRWASALTASVVTIAAAAAFCALSGVGIVDAFREPLEVSRISVAPGAGDIMTLIQQGLSIESSNLAIYGIGVATAICLVMIGNRRAPERGWMTSLAIASLASLMSFKHLTHDFVFLLPVLVVALSLSSKPRAIVLAVAAFQWFGLGVLSEVGIPGYNPLVVLASFVSLVVAYGVLVTCTKPTHEHPSESLAARHFEGHRL